MKHRIPPMGDPRNTAEKIANERWIDLVTDDDHLTGPEPESDPWLTSPCVVWGAVFAFGILFWATLIWMVLK